ncbi:MAG: hypothetical protein OES20_16110 [Gammaproteobacteria bacterium]|nr:hypothetical protein [Gammaproteobacteria bacterium]MDH3859500.1 hypothetical protein [Gammaproteobacteria bacterium]
MSDNAEEGIARVQMAQKDGLQNYHKRSVLHLDDRILTAIFALAFLGLIVVWATATSPYIIYGSLVASILIVILWGVVRVKKIQQIKEQRELQVKQMQSGSGE